MAHAAAGRDQGEGLVLTVDPAPAQARALVAAKEATKPRRSGKGVQAIACDRRSKAT